LLCSCLSLSVCLFLKCLFTGFTDFTDFCCWRCCYFYLWKI
jgi:hypothetical protein